MPDMSVLELINEVAADRDHIQDISVLPLLCGTGKSTAISYKIKETIEQAKETGKGLLIITDRVERMDEYMHPYIQDLQDYLLAHEDEVTIMHHENLEEAYKTHRYRPVLLMTTQRFFRLPPMERTKFLTWEHGTRPLVLIDERPELTTVVELDESRLNDCIIAVDRALGEEFIASQATEISIIKERFKQFTTDLKFSPCGSLDHLFCFWSWYTNEQSYETFPYEILSEMYKSIYLRREAINSYKGEIYYEDIYTRIRASRQLRNEKALLCHQKLRSGIQMDSIYTLLNNTSAFDDRSVKYIILDGTATLSPEYRINPYVFHSCNGFERDLKKLKIRIINVPTNKTSMLYDLNYRNRVQDYVECYFNENIRDKIDGNKKKYAIFTYKGIVDKYIKLFDSDRVDYFGNIIGKNDFRESTHILQIGINRYPDAVYYLYYLALHPELSERFDNMQEAYNMISVINDLPSEEHLESMGKTLEQWIDEHPEIIGEQKDSIDSDRIINQSNEIEQQMREYHGEVESIMNHMLLAEIEQHIFRGIIRNSNPSEDYTFHLFINTSNYKPLIELMKARYEPLGADIQVEAVSAEIAIAKIMRRKNARLAQAFITWHDKELEIGTIYTPENIREGIGLKNKSAIQSYEQLIWKNPVFRELLLQDKDEIETNERGVYIKKRNWYFN